jgi:hypothetical protein
MYCTKCGSELPKNSNYCTRCRQEVWAAIKKTDVPCCPKCGNQLPSGNNFCEHCNQVIVPVLRTPVKKNPGGSQTGINTSNNKIIIGVIVGFAVLILICTLFNKHSYNANTVNTNDINATKETNLAVVNPDEITFKMEIQDSYNEKGKQKVVLWVKNESAAVFNGELKIKVYAQGDNTSKDFPVDGGTFEIKELLPRKTAWEIMWIKPEYLMTGSYTHHIEGNFESNPKVESGAEGIAKQYYKSQYDGEIITCESLGEVKKGEKIIDDGSVYPLSGERFKITSKGGISYIYVKDGKITLETLVGNDGKEWPVRENPIW